MKKIPLWKKITFYAILVIVWQVVATADVWPNTIFPSPIEVAEDLAYSAADGSLFYGIGTSMWRLLIGLAIAIGGGVLLGIFMARMEIVNQTIGSLVLGLQSIPSVAWVPLAILWFVTNYRMVDGYVIHDTCWCNLGIFVHWWKFSFNGKQSQINFYWSFQFYAFYSYCNRSCNCRIYCILF